MAAPKGFRPPGGSRKGIPNKVTGDVKAMILAALDGAGGAAYLLRQAEANPGAFMTLVGKVLPTQHTGPDDGPIQIDVSAEKAARAIALIKETFAEPKG